MPLTSTFADIGSPLFAVGDCLRRGCSHGGSHSRADLRPQIVFSEHGIAPRQDDEKLSLQVARSKEKRVDVAAKVTSKGQITVPKVVREALGIKEGDEVVFRVEGNRAVLARTTDFLALAGTFKVPAGKRSA